MSYKNTIVVFVDQFLLYLTWAFFFFINSLNFFCQNYYFKNAILRSNVTQQKDVNFESRFQNIIKFSWLFSVCCYLMHYCMHFLICWHHHYFIHYFPEKVLLILIVIFNQIQGVHKVLERLRRPEAKINMCP